MAINWCKQKLTLHEIQWQNSLIKCRVYSSGNHMTTCMSLGCVTG